MRRQSRSPLWLLGIAVLVAAAAVMGAGTAEADLYMPMLQHKHQGPFQLPATSPPTITQDPSLPTNTQAPATRTPRPTYTPPPSPTFGASPTPTLPGEEVNYPTDPETIVIQMGWTDLFGGTFSAVWEEMNGTPWVTIYGDGRVIASKNLPNREQDLLLGQVDEYTLQKWLRGFAYEAQYFDLGEEYTHIRDSNGHLHYFVQIDGGYKRLSLNGYRSFERYPMDVTPEMPYTQILAVLKLTREIESWMVAHLTEPYPPEQYTIVVQEDLVVKPDGMPIWKHTLDLHAIAEAAPRTGDQNSQRKPGHSFQDRANGEAVRAIILPEADTTWATENRAAVFTSGGKYYVVGARPEVPGGSMFLPDALRAHLYRRDGPQRLSAELLQRLADSLWQPPRSSLVQPPGAALYPERWVLPARSGPVPLERH